VRSLKLGEAEAADPSYVPVTNLTGSRPLVAGVAIKSGRAFQLPPPPEHAQLPNIFSLPSL
jgi:hypothetical protein